MTPTPEQIAQWALESGFQPHRSGQLIAMHSNGSWVGLDEELQRFAALVDAHRAEQDAKMLEHKADYIANSAKPHYGIPHELRRQAAAIRASVKTPS